MKEANQETLTLSRVEMHRVAQERVSQISKEFTDGFAFLEDYPRSITFFGAHQLSEDDPSYKDAETLAGRLVKELGYSVISGGGPGIMEAANRGAFEAGGDSLGLLIKLPGGQVTNKYITKEFQAYYFFVRKVLLSFSAEAFIFYPGGFGTLDEFFEMLTLIQTKKINDVPIICVGSSYWNGLRKFMEKDILPRDLIEKSDIELFHIMDNHDKIIELIKSMPVRGVDPIHKKNDEETSAFLEQKLKGKIPLV